MARRLYTRRTERHAGGGEQRGTLDRSRRRRRRRSYGRQAGWMRRCLVADGDVSDVPGATSSYG